MPITLKIDKVSLSGQTDPHQRVQFVHGPVGKGEWCHTQEQAIEYIESWQFSYYLQKDGRAVRLVVGRTDTGEKYLKAATDGDIPTLLLELPSLVPNIN